MADSEPTGHSGHGRDAAVNRAAPHRRPSPRNHRDDRTGPILLRHPDPISAASRALRAVALTLLDEHLQHCLADHPGSVSQAKAKEASEAIARLVRS